MKLRRITLCNIRRFTDPVTLGPLGDGVNVLCAPNEFGKSTIFDAMRALFFTPHGSTGKDIRAMRPHAGGAPEVAVDLDIAQGSFRIAKRWLSKPMARVTQDGRLIAQADEAEAWIADRVGGADGGPAGLLWVQQGLTGLEGDTRGEKEKARAARRDLLSSVTGEVEALTGGRRMDAALARCRAELDGYATATGRPKAGGPWADAQARVAGLNDDLAQLRATATALQDALDTRRRSRLELADLTAPETVAARMDRLKAARDAFETAKNHAAQIDAATRAVASSELAVKSAAQDLKALQDARREHHDATAALTDAQHTAQQADARVTDAETSMKTAADAQAAAEQARVQADAADRKAQARHAATLAEGTRADLTDRLTRAETARSAAEQARAQAATGPDDATVAQLDKLAARVVTAQALRDSSATRLTVRYAMGQGGAISVNGTPLQDGVPVMILRDTELSLDGIGTLAVHPGGGQDVGHDLGKARSDLADALAACGAGSLDAARDAQIRRRKAAQDMDRALTELSAIAPEGIDRLRAALAALPEAPEDADTAPVDPEAARTALATARTAEITASAARDSARDSLSGATVKAAQARAAVIAADDRLRRASARIADLPDADEAALARLKDTAAADLSQAQAALETCKADAPDIDAAQATLTRAQSVIDSAQSQIDRLRTTIAKLDGQIMAASGDAVEERLAETEERLEAATADLDRITREVAVLQRLANALDAARSAARDRYFEPVARELRPLLHLLWPEAEMVWADDTLLPQALIRDGQPEPIDILSGGTQEQIALLVRLAFARMLAREGRHAPVILDDALVYTDDDRIERMFDALHRQASDLQILVLSCRQRAFRALGGQALHVDDTDQVIDG
jgi:hypothetical protein